MDGEGVIVLRDAAGEPAFFPATKLAATLANDGIRLVVLGACEGGRRNAISAWTGVVPALTPVGIPAIIGMQFTVQDASAILFSKASARLPCRPARGLTRRLPMDGAVRSSSAGRPTKSALGRAGALSAHRDGERGALPGARCGKRGAANPCADHHSPAERVAGSRGNVHTHKACVLAELLQPILIQLDRTHAAFSRWTGKNLYLEAKIIREGNLAVRDLLISKAELIPADLVSHANKLIVHYDRWLEEFDRLRGGQPAARR